MYTIPFQKHVTIPVFLPELGCGHKCIFCNQRQITSQKAIPQISDIRAFVYSYLKTISKDKKIQIGFFGGSFTGLPQKYQKQLLDLAQQFVASKQVHSIRLSTRPDYINPDILSFLRQYTVDTVELGIQSFCPKVLALSRRGHSAAQAEQACGLIKKSGIRLGAQIMLGLPGDNSFCNKKTARKVLSMGADDARIYPVLVIGQTELAQKFLDGQYKPLTLDQAISRAAQVLHIWQDRINVIKLGLHPTKDFLQGRGYLAGPYHKSFAQLVYSRIVLQKIMNQVGSARAGIRGLVIGVSPRWINFAVGYSKINLQYLRKKFGEVIFYQDSSLNDDIHIKEKIY